MAGFGEVVGVDDRGVTLRAAGSEPLVVDLEGRFAWSFTPDRDCGPSTEGPLAAWPAVMRPYLQGLAQVRVRSTSGHAFFDDEVSFGDGSGRVALVDSYGHAVSVDKAGHLVRAFSERGDAEIGAILDGTLRLLADLQQCGVAAFLCFGALLGAIREGGMLAHDSDVDLAYVSRHTSPADVVRESYTIERGLREAGWTVRRMGGHDVKSILQLNDGSRCQIDIFPGFYVDDIFYLMPGRSGPLAVEDLLPLSSISLLGRDFPAPRRPEVMLGYLYGSGWRVPDPSFQFDHPADGLRRLNGWLRGAQPNVGLWIDHWNSPEGKACDDVPSDFARWVDDRIGGDEAVVDLSAGRGADTRYLVQQGHRVLSTEYASAALHHLRSLTEQPDGDLANQPLEIAEIRLGDLRHTMWLGARLARDPHHIYGRQLLGALGPEGWRQLWAVASMATRGGSKLFLEFSAGRSRDRSAPYRKGMMRRIPVDQVTTAIEAAGGVIEHQSIETGTNAWGNPDPRVCRLIASWQAANPHRKAS